MSEKVKKLLEESEKLKRVRVNEIIDFISGISRKFPKSRYIKKISEEISKKTDYSERMIEFGIKNAFLSFQNKNNLKRFLRLEIYNEKILDEWYKIGKNIYLKAVSPPFINVIFSGNIPGIETQIIFPALLSKTCIYAKPSYKMHAFLKKFKEYIINNFKKFSNFIEIEIFTRDEEKQVREFLKNAKVLVIQGDTENIRKIKKMVEGVEKIIEYPTMFGAGIIKKKDFSKKILKNLALDIFLYNHRGCMSPFVIFLEEKIDFDEFCKIVDFHINELKNKYYAKEIDFNERVRKRQIIDSLLFEKDLLIQGYDFKFVKVNKIIDLFFPGIIQIIYYKKPKDVLIHLAPFSRFLQSFALSSFDKEIVQLIAENTSCIRITKWGKMQFPPLFFANKGSFGIKQFLKFCVFEK